MAKLLSDQIDESELVVIVRELKRIVQDNIAGDVVEFGCYVGTTSVFLAKILQNTNKKLYLYDSFAGLPEKSIQDNSPLGEQFKAGELLATRKQLIKNLQNAKVPMPIIKKAWFSDLIDRDLPVNISFAFLDGDYYDSILDSLLLIEKHLSKGSIIVIDDYGNDALPGAARAVDKWLSTKTYSKRIEQSLAIIRI